MNRKVTGDLEPENNEDDETDVMMRDFSLCVVSALFILNLLES